MIRIVHAALLAGTLLPAATQLVWATGANLTGAGGLVSAPNTDTGAREWVALTSEGGLLVGETKHDLIRAVAVDAPGHGAGHLIVRDLATPDGRRSLLVNGPPSLEASARRVTLFVRHPSTDIVLAHQVGGDWKFHYPEHVAPTRTAGREPPTDGALAFQVAGMGFFWILEPQSSRSGSPHRVPPDPSARELMGGGVGRGLLPILVAALVLGLGIGLSVWVHRTQRSRED